MLRATSKHFPQRETKDNALSITISLIIIERYYNNCIVHMLRIIKLRSRGMNTGATVGWKKRIVKDFIIIFIIILFVREKNANLINSPICPIKVFIAISSSNHRYFAIELISFANIYDDYSDYIRFNFNLIYISSSEYGLKLKLN